MPKKVQPKRTQKAQSPDEPRLVSIPFAPMLDLLGAVRDHGKLGDLRAQLQHKNIRLTMSNSDVAALKHFIESDPILSMHPIAANFTEAPIGEDGDLGFGFGR